MKTSLRSRVYAVLEGEAASSPVGMAVHGILLLLILSNVLVSVEASVVSIADRYARWFDAFDAFSVTIFTVEYLARLWCCVEDPRFRSPVLGRLRFALGFLPLVDLAAVISFSGVLLAGGADYRFLRVLRILRILRILKLGRYSQALLLVGRVVAAKKEQLAAALVCVFVLITIAAGLIYEVERQAQPEAFGSIPESMWWAVVTLTTVGYGDVYPVTPVGRVLASLLALFGVAMFGLPAGILASGFMEELSRRRGDIETCPHCGKPIR
ncbi:MAG: potassium voltage gated channel, Shab-related subfamily, member 2 [Armatimonadota bacterium]|nr:MAG: potassium voltage gated channel, Shab-related subfamily, member 2 [Armatimonadota bacterium]